MDAAGDAGRAARGVGDAAGAGAARRANERRGAPTPIAGRGFYYRPFDPLVVS
jgi:hypothetical protein